jgi:hypothetical protein
MKRKIDFIIREEDDEKLLFRFYPRRSHVHSFNDKPPTNWDEVYKVYFAYSIIRQIKWSDDENWESEIMYDESFDECSAIDQVSALIKQILEGKNEKDLYDIHPFGDGTSYKIEKWADWNKNPHWQFMMFQSYTNKGYRFSLRETELLEFRNKIEYFLEYMLEHGEEI